MPTPLNPASFGVRIRTALELIAGLDRHDLRAARTFVSTFYPGRPLPVRIALFASWTWNQIWRAIPETAAWASFSNPVSKMPIWLAQGDPFENHPFNNAPAAMLPERAEVVVVGAGMVGAAAAYHWSKAGRAPMVVVEMNGVASGSAFSNPRMIMK